MTLSKNSLGLIAAVLGLLSAMSAISFKSDPAISIKQAQAIRGGDSFTACAEGQWGSKCTCGSPECQTIACGECKLLINGVYVSGYHCKGQSGNYEGLNGCYYILDYSENCAQGTPSQSQCTGYAYSDASCSTLVGSMTFKNLNCS